MREVSLYTLCMYAYYIIRVFDYNEEFFIINLSLFFLLNLTFLKQ